MEADTLNSVAGEPMSMASNRQVTSFSPADFTIVVFLTILALVSIFPFYNMLIMSFGEAKAIADQKIYLLPVSFDFSAYKYIFGNKLILDSFLISVFVTVVGVVLRMIFTTAMAYALTKKTLPGRKLFFYAIIFTMFFSGGLIPYYLTVKNLALTNSIWVLVVPDLINTFYMLVMYSHFRTLPPALEESAKIDGANEVHILARIIVPISLPTIAAISLFYAVDRWNEWWHAMLFIRDVDKYPLQMLLRQMLINFNQIFQGKMAATFAHSSKPILPETLKMAVVVVSTIPVLMVYPFLLKHFAKGVLIGSIKE